MIFDTVTFVATTDLYVAFRPFVGSFCITFRIVDNVASRISLYAFVGWLCREGSTKTSGELETFVTKDVCIRPVQLDLGKQRQYLLRINNWQVLKQKQKNEENKLPFYQNKKSIINLKINKINQWYLHFIFVSLVTDVRVSFILPWKAKSAYLQKLFIVANWEKPFVVIRTRRCIMKNVKFSGSIYEIVQIFSTVLVFSFFHVLR